MFGMQGMEIILIVAVLFLLFGASRLPQLAKSLGQSRKAFKEGMLDAENEFKDEEEARKTAPPVVRQAQLSGVSDDDLLEEARRRAAVRER